MNENILSENNILKPNEISMKRSVRTTFKISKETNDSLNTLLKKLKIKPKELFDEICSNEKLIQSIIKTDEEICGILNQRKTLVISKHTLKFLSQKSFELKIPRDVLFNKIILSFKLMIDVLYEKEREKEQVASGILENFYDEAEKIENQLKELLGNDNPITERFEHITIVIMNLSSAINSKLTEGRPIDPSMI
ncbi:hypothetical protein JW935_08660 [candidate division KSB1 bacterium]|nr:hypothetical protein [candidate division KSB1 bacterium]